MSPLLLLFSEKWFTSLQGRLCPTPGLSLLLHFTSHSRYLQNMNTSLYKGSVRSLSSTNKIAHLTYMHEGIVFSPTGGDTVL